VAYTLLRISNKLQYDFWMCDKHQAAMSGGFTRIYLALLGGLGFGPAICAVMPLKCAGDVHADLHISGINPRSGGLPFRSGYIVEI
jgi:hypothetical protein